MWRFRVQLGALLHREIFLIGFLAVALGATVIDETGHTCCGTANGVPRHRGYNCTEYTEHGGTEVQYVLYNTDSMGVGSTEHRAAWYISSSVLCTLILPQSPQRLDEFLAKSWTSMELIANR